MKQIVFAMEEKWPQIAPGSRTPNGGAAMMYRLEESPGS
jgi:hypothetical protein